jgi:hypothetical protein
VKHEINELQRNSDNRNRDINEFKKDYQSIINLVWNENSDILADSHNILNRQKNYFCQLLNVHDVNDVRQAVMHTAGPF